MEDRSNIKILSVILVTYKNLSVVKECLDSIIKWNDIGDMLEVIVVDNTPDDESIYNYIKTNYKKIKIIKNNNKGFGEANNVGTKISKGKYLLFLNSDTILIEPIFKFSIDKFEEDNNLGMFGIKLYNRQLSKSQSYYLLDKRRTLYNDFLIKMCNKFDIFNYKNMFISGADMFIRKKYFLKIGMFDENIFMYSEEADITRRMRKYIKNVKIKFFKQKGIIHLANKSSENYINSQKCALESERYYCNKYGFDFKKRLKNNILLAKKKMIIYKYISKDKYTKNLNLKMLYENTYKELLV